MELNSDAIVAAKGGDPDAIGVVLLRGSAVIRPMLSRNIPRHLKSVVSVDDLLQQTITKAFERMDTLKTNSLEGFVAWLKQIGMRELHDTIRREKSKKRGGEFNRSSLHETPNAARSPSSFVASKEAIQRIREEISELPDEQRTAIELCYCQGMERTDAAAAMDKTEQGLRSLLLRARKKLKLLMDRKSLWFN